MNQSKSLISGKLLADHWAMEPRAFEAFCGKIRLLEEPEYLFHQAIAGIAPAAAGDPLAFFLDEEPQKRSRMTVQGGVASIPVTGVLLKAVPKVFRYWGIEATSYRDIQDDLAKAIGDESVKSIRLVVDSPGGRVGGAKETADAIAAARQAKPVQAEIDEMGASAAYWLASQANRITVSPNAMVGSIGAVVAYLDSSKAAEKEGFKVHVIASGPHKGMGIPGAPITDDQVKAIKDVIDGMAANFVADVARGRGRNVEKVQEWATGQIWIAKDAKALGLVDHVATGRIDGSADGRPAAEFLNREEETMSSDPKTAGPDEIRAKAAADVREAEKTRVKEIKTAFPEDPGFALAQIEAGSTLAEAKAAYADVVVAENAKLKKENEDLRKAPAPQKAKPSGAQPLAHSEPAAASGGDFMARAQAYSEEHQVPMRQAMSHLAKAEPELFLKYRENCLAAAPAHAARKKELGIR